MGDAESASSVSWSHLNAGGIYRRRCCQRDLSQHGTHAEAIEITFDPQKLTYRNVLEFFFQIHDPTTPYRQGNDEGSSYRSAIFYLNDEQRQIAEKTISDIEASGIWPGKIVTAIAPAGPLWEAEPEHQDYLERHPNGYTCHFIRPAWKIAS